MSSSVYSVKLVFQQQLFYQFLQFLQAHQAGDQHTFLLSWSQEEIQLRSASKYFLFHGKEYRLDEPDVRISINFPLRQSWFQTFDYRLTIMLPVDLAFIRYLTDSVRETGAKAGKSRPAGHLVVRARGLEHLKPEYVEVELLPIISQQFLLESESWRHWLIQLAEATQAMILYTAAGYSTYTILWHRGQQVKPLSIQNFDDLPDAGSALVAAQALLDAAQDLIV